MAGRVLSPTALPQYGVLTETVRDVIDADLQTASANAPASAAAAGVAGQIAYDATHIYVCLASGSWVRATTAAW